jgi:hypothetical protein
MPAVQRQSRLAVLATLAVLAALVVLPFVESAPKQVRLRLCSADMLHRCQILPIQRMSPPLPVYTLQASSCYAFDLTKRGDSSFGGAKSPVSTPSV